LGLAVCVGIFVFALDQLTKIAVLHRFSLGESLPVLPPLFALTYVRNEGAAWSILSGHGWFLLLIALLVTVAVIYFFRELTERCVERYFALLLVLGGVAGNSLDRILHGAVIDFLDFHWYDFYHYPVFNVADIAICVGVGLFVLSTLLRPTNKPPAT
jgi:signal peptidase II